MITLMSFLVAAGDYPDVFPVAAGGYPDVFPGDYPHLFPGGCWWLP